MYDTANFLNEKYKTHYLIFNLAIEREYNEKPFFGNIIKYHTMYHHSVPTLYEMFEFAYLLYRWLSDRSKNIAIIHCKGGKARTGLMLCAYYLIHYKFC